MKQLFPLGLLTLPLLLVGCLPPDQPAQTTQPPGASAAPAPADPHAAHTAPATETTPATETAPAAATPAGDLPLTVTGATVTAVPATLTDTVAYISLRNTGPDDIVISGASSPAAEHTMLMETVSSGAGTASMSGMVDVPSLTVPAGGELVMESAGNHFMLMGLKEPLKEGSEVPVTLQAADGRTLEVKAVVTRP